MSTLRKKNNAAKLGHKDENIIASHMHAVRTQGRVMLSPTTNFIPHIYHVRTQVW